MSLIPLRSYTHFVAMKGRIFSHRGHVRPIVFLTVHPLRIHTSHVPCASLGRGLRGYTQLVAAEFANLSTHNESTHVSLCLAALGHFSGFMALLCSKHIWAVVLLLGRLSFKVQFLVAAKIHTSRSTCGFNTHSGHSRT